MLLRKLTACALFLLILLLPPKTLGMAQTPDPGAYPVYNLGTSAAIFVTAFSVAGVILIVHRSILPQLGIWIGSERREKRTREKAVQNPSQSDGGEK
jgi:hypothetical protein